MILIGIGAACVLAGVLLMALQPMQRRMSGGRDGAGGAVVSNKTLEPPRPASGFGLASNWPGLALVGIGGACLLVGAAM